ncbi:MAG TPA: hypothetical protein VLM17_03340 [Xanthomonadaceae bacterium]|nr:hypothetical protein [Xanthomonadaceae bacterium]
MKILSRLMLIACLVLPFAGCKKEEAPQAAATPPMAAPQNDDMNAWRNYLQDIVPRYMGAGTSQPYVYLLPGESTADFNDVYTRLAQKAKEDLGRGIVSGNLLAFASPASAKCADMVVDAFKDVPAGSMKGVKVLFIGKAADNDRVKAAVAPAGVDYTFVETK